MCSGVTPPDRHGSDAKNAGWVASCLLDSYRVCPVFVGLKYQNTHGAAFCYVERPSFTCGWDHFKIRAQWRTGLCLKLTSLTSLLIFRAFFRVILSSDVRLWKCDVPFILFKSCLYFSCKGMKDDVIHLQEKEHMLCDYRIQRLAIDTHAESNSVRVASLKNDDKDRPCHCSASSVLPSDDKARWWMKVKLFHSILTLYLQFIWFPL